MQKATWLLADGLCPRADTSWIQGLGATMKTNTRAPAKSIHFHWVKKKWIYIQPFKVIDLIDLIDMKNNTILKLLTEMSKDIFKVLLILVLWRILFSLRLTWLLKTPPNLFLLHKSPPPPRPRPRNQRLTNKLPFEKKVSYGHSYSWNSATILGFVEFFGIISHYVPSSASFIVL